MGKVIGWAAAAFGLAVGGGALALHIWPHGQVWSLALVGAGGLLVVASLRSSGADRRLG